MLPSIASARSLFSQVCRPSITAAKSLVQPLSVHARTFASVLPSAPSISETSGKPDAAKEGALRPHLGIEVNPNHGLYAFFRKKMDKEGNSSWETVEPREIITDNTGRSWTAAELRRKSFKDLHTLWYILLRERNLLATQAHELKRLRAHLQVTSITKKAFRVRKSMARIKYVINERRLAYEGALRIHEEGRLELLAAKQARREVHKARLAAIAAEEKKVHEAEEVELKEKEKKGPTSADMAAAGLFDVVGAHAPPSSSSESHKKSS